MGNKQSIQEAQSLEASLDFIKNLENYTYGEVRIMKNKASDQQFAIKQTIANSSQQFSSSLTQANQIQKQDFKSLLKLERVISSEQNELCSKIYSIIQAYEYHEETLKDHLDQNQKFTEFEILEFIDHSLSALMYLNELGYAHTDVSPESFVYDKSKRMYKTVDSQYMTGINMYKRQLYQDAESKQILQPYLAPELLQNLKELKSQPQYDTEKGDIFSLGLVIIQMGIQKSCSQLYENHGSLHFQINHKNLMEYQKIFTDKHSGLLSGIVNDMLTLDHELRPNFKELGKFILNMLKRIFLNMSNSTKQSIIFQKSICLYSFCYMFKLAQKLRQTGGVPSLLQVMNKGQKVEAKKQNAIITHESMGSNVEQFKPVFKLNVENKPTQFNKEIEESLKKVPTSNNEKFQVNIDRSDPQKIEKTVYYQAQTNYRQSNKRVSFIGQDPIGEGEKTPQPKKIGKSTDQILMENKLNPKPVNTLAVNNFIKQIFIKDLNDTRPVIESEGQSLKQVVDDDIIQSNESSPAINLESAKFQDSIKKEFKFQRVPESINEFSQTKNETKDQNQILQKIQEYDKILNSEQNVNPKFDFDPFNQKQSPVKQVKQYQNRVEDDFDPFQITKSTHPVQQQDVRSSVQSVQRQSVPKSMLDSKDFDPFQMESKLKGDFDPYQKNPKNVKKVQNIKDSRDFDPFFSFDPMANNKNSRDFDPMSNNKNSHGIDPMVNNQNNRDFDPMSDNKYSRDFDPMAINKNNRDYDHMANNRNSLKDSRDFDPFSMDMPKKNQSNFNAQLDPQVKSSQHIQKLSNQKDEFLVATKNTQNINTPQDMDFDPYQPSYKQNNMSNKSSVKNHDYEEKNNYSSYQKYDEFNSIQDKENLKRSILDKYSNYQVDDRSEQDNSYVNKQQEFQFEKKQTPQRKPKIPKQTRIPAWDFSIQQ